MRSCTWQGRSLLEQALAENGGAISDGASARLEGSETRPWHVTPTLPAI
jgi:hypothetical protein